MADHDQPSPASPAPPLPQPGEDTASIATSATAPHKPARADGTELAHLPAGALRSVGLDLHYLPQLRVDSRIADLQDLLRPSGWTFRQTRRQQSPVPTPTGEPELVDVHLFQGEADAPGVLAISRTSATIEIPRYAVWDEYIARVGPVLGAMRETLGIEGLLRASLRYQFLLRCKVLHTYGVNPTAVLDPRLFPEFGPDYAGVVARGGDQADARAPMLGSSLARTEWHYENREGVIVQGGLSREHRDRPDGPADPLLVLDLDFVVVAASPPPARAPGTPAEVPPGTPSMAGLLAFGARAHGRAVAIAQVAIAPAAHQLVGQPGLAELLHGHHSNVELPSAAPPPSLE